MIFGSQLLDGRTMTADLIAAKLYALEGGDAEGHLHWSGNGDRDCIRRTLDLVKPTHGILEIGFNAGHSALMWLSMSPAPLVSLDIGKYAFTRACAELLREEYGTRFTYIEVDSTNEPAVAAALTGRFDLAFIDGLHTREAMLADTRTALGRGVPFLLYDDYDSACFDGIKIGVEECCAIGLIEKVVVLDPEVGDGRTLVLCRNMGVPHAD